MKIIQRLGSGAQTDETYLSKLLAWKKKYPRSYNDVWLATDYGFPPIEVHREHARHLALVAKQFRDAGVTVSLQLSNSIGHGQYMASCDCSGLVYPGSPVSDMVGPDGAHAVYCFCPRGEALKEYLVAELTAYCEAIKPDYVWIDDDFRPDNHRPVSNGCFCDDCVARFNRENGYTFTREQLVEQILHGDLSVREKFIAYNRRDFGALMNVMCRAMHEASPDTSFGLQNAFHAWGGGDLDYCFDNMKPYSKNAPAYRGGGGAYGDGAPGPLFDKALQISFQNSRLPDYVTLRVPEIENLPFMYSEKTPAGNALETALNLAAGNTGLSYSMMMHVNDEDEYYDECFGLLDRMAPYFEKLGDLSARSVGGGLNFVTSENDHLRPFRETEGFEGFRVPPFEPIYPLLTNGIPICFDAPKTAPVLLYAGNVSGMTDAELEELLARPVLTDGEAVARLIARGFDPGVTVKKIPDEIRGMFFERFTDDPINEGLLRDVFSTNYFVPGGRAPIYAIENLSEISRPLARYNAVPVAKDVTSPGVSSAIVKTPRGGNWAIIGMGLWVGVVPKYQNLRLYRIADALGVSPLPIRVLSLHRAYVFPRLDPKTGKTLGVSVANCTVGFERVKLAVRNPASEKFVFLSQYGTPTPLTPTRDGDEYIFDLPALPAYSVGTLFCE